MTTIAGRTNLSLFVNGDLRAWTNETSYAVRDGYLNLYLGKDVPAGTYFKGVVDEFRLYKTALSQDSVRGLMWFQGWANSLVVPRGLFYDSKLFAKMTDTSSDLMSGPLAGAVVRANTNPGSANLNMRVIQMAIVKNVTIREAYTLLTMLWTNKTGNLTAFPFFAAPEFYTLGVSWEVAKLVANTSVVNTGNYSAPQPSPNSSFWDAVWNTVCGAASVAWNAVVSVAVFLYRVGKWLVDAAIGVVIGLTTGNWTYFEQNVVEPFKKALEALIGFIINLVTAALRVLVDGLLKPILAPVQAAVSRIVAGMKQALDIDPPLGPTLTSLLLAALPLLLFLATVILLIMIGIGLAIQSFPIAGLVIAAVVLAILWAVFLAMMPKDPRAADPGGELAFLSRFDQDHGREVYLFGAFDVWGGQIAAALTVWDGPPGAEDWAVLAAIVWDMFTFFVDSIAEGTMDHTPGACTVGVFGLTLSGIGLALSAQAVLLFPKSRGPGLFITYLMLTGSLFLLAGLSFAADSGYVLRNCG